MPDSEMFGYPLWAVPAEQQNGLLLVASVLALVSLSYALWFSRREKSLYPIFVFLGAGCSVLYEPLGDLLTKVAYPPIEQQSLMTSFGRPIPLWMLPNYFFFFCTPILLLLQFVVRAQVSRATWWATYAGLVLFVALFEQPGIAAQSWKYYAENQAFSVNTYPVWVAFVNAQSLLLMAAGVCLLRRVIAPRASVVVVFVVPMLLVASHVGVSLPIVSALYSTDNRLLTNAAALATIGMCLFNVWLAHRVVAASAPAADDAQRSSTWTGENEGRRSAA